MKSKVLYLLIILFPIVDLITALTVRFDLFPISLGMIYKSFIIILLFIYLLLSKKLFKRRNILYLVVLFLYICLFFGLHTELFSSAFLKIEVINMLKYIYFPLILLGLYNLYEDNKINLELSIKSLLIVFGIYLLLLFIPNILGIGNNTYELEYLKGQVGWFYSANELSGILIILLPFIYYFLKEKKYIYYFLYLLLSCYCSTSIGTKAALIGLIVNLIIILLIYLFNNSIKFINRVIVILLSGIIIFLFTNNSYALYNHGQNVDHIENPNLQDIEPHIIRPIINNDIHIDINNSFIEALYSSRLDYFENTVNIYVKSRKIDKLFGIGFSNTNIVNNYTIEKNIEIDLLDYFFHYGIIGFVVMMLPLLYILIITIIKKRLFQKGNLLLVISFVNGIGASLIAGHILNAPSVATILGIIIVLLLIEKNNANYII